MIAPTLITGLGASQSLVSLTSAIFTLMVAAFLLGGAALGDIHGRKRIMLIGIGATMFANHLCYWGDFHYSQTVGPARAQGFSPLATALRLGVGVSTHSDTPVSPIDPLFSAWCAANRVTSSGRILGANERLGVLDALKLVTINAAWLLHRDHELGSIQVGKRADFTVLGADPLAIAADELKDVPVLGTVLGGQPVVL